jgi:hypothetical protein
MAPNNGLLPTRLRFGERLNPTVGQRHGVSDDNCLASETEQEVYLCNTENWDAQVGKFLL